MTASITGSLDGSGNLEASLEFDFVEKGVHEIKFIGSMGTVAVGKFAFVTGLEPRLRRGVLATNDALFAPLAQTFSVESSRDVAGFEIYLTTKGSGSGDIVGQLREVEAGIPTQTILAEDRIAYADLSVGWKRFTFPPVNLTTDREYALVLYTGNLNHAVAIADLGEVDEDTNEAVTRQSYRQGVLLSSSNGTAWTINQTRDLTFRLLSPNYSSTSRTVNLGDVTGSTVDNASDLIILGEYDLPTTATKVSFIVTDEDDAEYTLDKDQPLRLPSSADGPFNLQAVLTGTSELSPVLFPDTQLVLGKVSTSGVYISKAIEVGEDFDYTVKLECKLEPGAGLTVAAEDASEDSYTTLTLDSAQTKVMSDGWERRVYKATGLEAVDTGTINKTRIKLTLTGTATARPFVRRLVGIETST